MRGTNTWAPLYIMAGGVGDGKTWGKGAQNKRLNSVYFESNSLFGHGKSFLASLRNLLSTLQTMEKTCLLHNCNKCMRGIPLVTST